MITGLGSLTGRLLPLRASTWPVLLYTWRALPSLGASIPGTAVHHVIATSWPPGTAVLVFPVQTSLAAKLPSIAKELALSSSTSALADRGKCGKGGLAQGAPVLLLLLGEVSRPSARLSRLSLPTGGESPDDTAAKRGTRVRRQTYRRCSGRRQQGQRKSCHLLKAAAMRTLPSMTC